MQFGLYVTEGKDGWLAQVVSRASGSPVCVLESCSCDGKTKAISSAVMSLIVQATDLAAAWLPEATEDAASLLEKLAESMREPGRNAECGITGDPA